MLPKNVSLEKIHFVAQQIMILLTDCNVIIHAIIYKGKLYNRNTISPIMSTGMSMALHLLFQVSPREICGGQGGTEIYFSQSTFISPVSYH
jgi:hypothetical protein